MPKEWQKLTALTAGSDFHIERVRLPEQDITIEGQFELPPLARLTAEDQMFVVAFVRCHGSIKQMEKFFGVSYPTIKNRLNRIGDSLPYVEIETESARPPASELLDRLERGEMNVNEVLAALQNEKGKEPGNG